MGTEVLVGSDSEAKRRILVVLSTVKVKLSGGQCERTSEIGEVASRQDKTTRVDVIIVNILVQSLRSYLLYTHMHIR